jgi:hypothetical protein
MDTIKSRSASLTVATDQHSIPTVVDASALEGFASQSIGTDCNLPLLVKDVGGQQIKRLQDRKIYLQEELIKLDRDLDILERLVAIVDIP